MQGDMAFKVCRSSHDLNIPSSSEWIGLIRWSMFFNIQLIWKSTILLNFCILINLSLQLSKCGLHFFLYLYTVVLLNFIYNTRNIENETCSNWWLGLTIFWSHICGNFRYFASIYIYILICIEIRLMNRKFTWYVVSNCLF